MLYVEGARDREILESWARRLEPGLARCIESSTVILGGRRPARAVIDFRKRGGTAAGLRGLVVLDRDHHDEQPGNGGEDPASGIEPASAPIDGVEELGDPSTESDLEVFVWGRRHIESYLLVPAAIRRVLRIPHDDLRVEQAIADQLVDGGESSSLHAKRILGAGGSLSEALGTELRAGDIARAMRAEDLHDDVHTLFGRIGTLSGLVEKGPEVVIRPTRSER